mmetsp:Transcript_39055/g.125565  ORF Transcript_39055/g.125565 Transcript_39055/m.125565 type:complete len:201 (+) Transcript_39055:964-1566(+)
MHGEEHVSLARLIQPLRSLDLELSSQCLQLFLLSFQWHATETLCTAQQQSLSRLHIGRGTDAFQDSLHGVLQHTIGALFGICAAHHATQEEYRHTKYEDQEEKHQHNALLILADRRDSHAQLDPCGTIRIAIHCVVLRRDRIRERVIRLLHQDELFHCSRFLVLVGVVLQRQPPPSLLHICLTRRPAKFKQPVRVEVGVK